MHKKAINHRISPVLEKKAITVQFLALNSGLVYGKEF